MSSAEAIAAVAADLRAHRVRGLPGGWDVGQFARARVQDPVVIDATAIHQPLIDNPDQHIAIYEDHPCIPPPFDEFVLAYLNTFGNVVAIHCSLDDDVARWETDAEVDWDRVRWRVQCFVYVGGHDGEGRPVSLTGPLYLWRLAIYGDGEPADVTWVDLAPDYDGSWDNAMLTLLGSLNFLGCRNVGVVEPARPRAERRRLERIGDGSIRVKTIQVFPAGRSSDSGEHTGIGVPLTTVRGHMAHYGAEYGRGLLFGKYSGRFWVPAYARGKAELGETRATYELRP